VRVRFRGGPDGSSCTVFGLTFQAGEWVELDDPPRKLLANPAFEVGEAEAAPEPAPKRRRVKRG
jgi:hypothetical protein